MISSTTSTSQIPPLASAQLTTDRETHRSARDNITHVELQRLTDRNRRVFAHLPPGRFSSPTTKTEVKNKVSSAPSITQPGFGFLCVFVSLRESFAPLARPQRAMLRGHATESSWLPPLEGDNLLLKNHISVYQSISRFDGIGLEARGGRGG